jgi:LPS export ABC transporter protein LptC
MTNRSFISLLLTSVSLLTACENDIAEIRAITNPRALPVQSNLNAEYRYTERGMLRNVLHAAQLDQYSGENPYVEASGGFEMSFFDSIGTEQAKLQAEAGTYYQKEHRMIAWGNVKLYNTKGESLTTSRLLYEQDSARISTDQFVKIVSGDGTFYGQGLVSNENFTKYKILQPTGDVYLED